MCICVRTQRAQNVFTALKFSLCVKEFKNILESVKQDENLVENRLIRGQRDIDVLQVVGSPFNN